MLQRHAPLLQLPLTLHDPFLNSRDQSEGSIFEAAANRKLIWDAIGLLWEMIIVHKRSFFAKITKVKGAAKK
jgi:hypothetical protein